MSKKASKKVKTSRPELTEIKRLEKEIRSRLVRLVNIRSKVSCYPLLLNDVNIGPRLVDEVFEELRRDFKSCNGKLDVIVDSGGGDIDAAYNLAQLFRKFGTTELNFIVPRWAKSAATLLVCSGNSILMTAVAELGPLDPQITAMNPLEGRLEQFSPLHIESTLALIREEFEKGNKELANALMERLQFPLTLGSFKKSLDIGKQYLVNLLSSRMLASKENGKNLSIDIANRLTEGYADHGFCINVDEAKNIGLDAKELDGEELDIVWEIHQLNFQKRRLEEKIRGEEIMKQLKELPPAILDKLPPELQQKLSPSPI